MTIRVQRWLRRLAFAAAAMPVFQAASGCDLLGLNQSLNQYINQQMTFSVFGSFVGATQSYLSTHFPSADIVQTFLGGNPNPFFTG